MGMVYIGSKSCGCVLSIISDKPELRRSIARETGKWIRDGFTVEHVTAEKGKHRFGHCSKHQEKGGS